MNSTITCSVCGYRFDPSEHAGCANCPIHEGCTTACCPNCGTTNINPSASRWAVWLDKLFHRPTAPSGNPAEAELTLDRVPAGRQAQILRFGSLGIEQDRHLQAYGLLPGRAVRVLASHPLIIIQVEETELALEKDVAQAVFVRLETPTISSETV